MPIICSEVLLTHLFFPGCVRLVGDLAHFWCSSSDPPQVPLKYKNSFGHKGGRRERLGAVKHVKRCRITARCLVDGSRGLKTSTFICQKIKVKFKTKVLVICSKTCLIWLGCLACFALARLSWSCLAVCLALPCLGRQQASKVLGPGY